MTTMRIVILQSLYIRRSILWLNIFVYFAIFGTQMTQWRQKLIFHCFEIWISLMKQIYWHREIVLCCSTKSDMYIYIYIKCFIITYYIRSILYLNDQSGYLLCFPLVNKFFALWTVNIKRNFIKHYKIRK